MAAVIRRKDLLKLGKKLLEEMFVFFNDEFFLSKFEELKVLQKVFMDKLKLNNIYLEDGKVRSTIDIENIYNVVKYIKFDMEIEEDLYFKKMAFMDIFRVLEVSYKYL